MSQPKNAHCNEQNDARVKQAVSSSACLKAFAFKILHLQLCGRLQEIAPSSSLRSKLTEENFADGSAAECKH
jgi:hypothetical protein